MFRTIILAKASKKHALKAIKLLAIYSDNGCFEGAMSPYSEKLLNEVKAENTCAQRILKMVK